ncbi:MAG: ammonia-forming cytochrome c nitrite reductase [Desulfuromonadales bacterium]
MNKVLISSVGVLAALLFIGTASVQAATTAGKTEIKSNNYLWAADYPHQFGTWKKTAESDEITDLLKEKPQLAILWAGYGFAKDYNAPRGHFYALQSNQNTLRTGAPVDAKTGPMPTACWTCKSPDVPRMIQQDGELEFFTGKWAKYGHEIANSIGCADCHDSKTAELTVGRPSLQRGLESAGLDMKTVSETEMRSLVCAQCHVEYYFKKTDWTDAAGNAQVANVVTLPWANGMTVEGMESYYDAIEFKDWTHKISKTPMLKAQHPGYEIYKSGIHAQNGVTCADCHMPVIKIEGETITDHQIKGTLDQMMSTCLDCHEETPEQFKEIVGRKLERKEQLMEIAMDNLAKAHLEAGEAWRLGATEEEMAEILSDLRHGQWRWDYSIASHGSFYHAPEETLRILGVANDAAQSARIKLAKVLARHGGSDYVAPDFSTKEKAQALAEVPLQALVDEKLVFKKGLIKEWEQDAIKRGILDPETRKGMSDNTAYKK